jgi:MFS superfamily sulfate permease-like transporter
MAQLRRRPLSANLSAGAEKLSLLTGVTAGLAYSIFASFAANALTPVSGYLVEADSFRRSVSGRYQEVLSLNGAIPILLASLIVFVLVWWSMRVILEHWQREDWGAHRFNRPKLVRRTVARTGDNRAAGVCSE